MAAVARAQEMPAMATDPTDLESLDAVGAVRLTERFAVATGADRGAFADR